MHHKWEEATFAQFIVNTTGVDATLELLDEYTPRYSGYFPEAVVRFKQLGYSEAVNPVEVRISGDSLSVLKDEADRIVEILRTMPELELVRTNFNEPLAATRIELDEDESIRLGITNASLETALAMRYGSGFPVATAWEGDYDINIVLQKHQGRLWPAIRTSETSGLPHPADWQLYLYARLQRLFLYGTMDRLYVATESGPLL